MTQEQRPPTPPAVMTVQEAEAIKKNIDVEQIYKQMAEKVVNEQLQTIANDRASREPLPTIVEDALLGTALAVPTSVGTITIRKMVAIDVTIFKLTESPFYKLLMGDIAEKDGALELKSLFPDEEILYSIVYQFTHAPKDIYKLVKQGKEAYHEVVVNEVIEKAYTPEDLRKLIEAILNYVGMVNKARVEFETTSTDDKKKLT